MTQWIIPVCAVIVLMATCTMARADYHPRQQGFGTYSKAYLDRQRLRWCKKKVGDNYQCCLQRRLSGY